MSFHSNEMSTASPETFAMLRKRASTVGHDAYSMVFFQAIDGEMCQGIVATDNGDDCYVSIRPRPSYNGPIVSEFNQWQTSGIGELRSPRSLSSKKRRRLIAEQLFLHSALQIGGRALLDCRADSERTKFILAGLRELRRRVRNGRPPGAEIKNLRILLEAADCPEIQLAA